MVAFTPQPRSVTCCAAPAGGFVEVIDGAGARVRFAAPRPPEDYSYDGSGDSALAVRWGGFAEPCAGVRNLAIELRDAAGAVLWTAGGLVEGTAALPPEVVAAFAHGAVYQVRVAATSHAGLTAEATAEFTVDLTPPTVAPVRVDGICKANATLGCSWGGAADELSGIAALEWAVGSEAGASDVLEFAPASAGRGGASRPAPAGLAADAVVYCSLRASNGAGLSVIAASAGAPRCGDSAPTCGAE